MQRASVNIEGAARFSAGRCDVLTEANKARQIIGVSFDLNDTVVKIARAFNTRRNSRFRDKYRKTEHYSNTGYLGYLRLFVIKS